MKFFNKAIKKRIAALVLATAVILSGTNVVFAGIIGDVNGNEKINIVDAQIAYDIACGSHNDSADYSSMYERADVNNDGYVTALDARAIQYYVHYGVFGIRNDYSYLSELKAGDYCEFGSYPQSEIVSQASDSGVNGKTWENAGDYIIDAEIYNTLSSLPDDEWNDNGDATVNGIKYRRIKESDATDSKSSDSSYYSWSSSDTYHYFKYEPIKWRVLEQNGSNVFLLSEIALDAQMYNANITGSVTWENSTIRSWLNGYGSTENSYGTDYVNDNFIDAAFSSAEQYIIDSTTLENKNNTDETIVSGNNTNDKVFLLSDDDTYGSNAAGYGFESTAQARDTARQSLSSTYAKAMGVESNDLGNCYWWLRSPGSHPGLFILVRESGSVYVGGQHANSKSRGVRPAIRVITKFD